MFSKIIKNEKGAGLVGAMVATGVAGLTTLAITSQMTMMSKAQSNFRSDIGMTSLGIDLRKTLISNQLCNQFLKPENARFNEKTKNINIRTMSKTLVSQKSDLADYHVTNVSISANNTVDLGTNSSGNRYYVSQLRMTGARRASKREMPPRDLGPLFIETDSSGAILNCNTSSLESVVQCESGQVKISRGEGKIPDCMTPSKLIGRLCPSGSLIGVRNGQIDCVNKPSAPQPQAVTITRNTSSTRPRPKCTADPAICAAYRNNLGRIPDQAGAKFYGDMLKGKSGAERTAAIRMINNNIAGSNEASGRRRTVKEIKNYNDYARRTGTSSRSCINGVNCR